VIFVVKNISICSTYRVRTLTELAIIGFTHVFYARYVLLSLQFGCAFQQVQPASVDSLRGLPTTYQDQMLLTLLATYLKNRYPMLDVLLIGCQLIQESGYSKMCMPIDDLCFPRLTPRNIIFRQALWADKLP
jgi:hypothetical protein